MSNEQEPGRVENEINEILARTSSETSAPAAQQGARDPLDRELRAIKEIIVRMWSLAEAAIRDALKALTTHDAELAEKIIVGDRTINAMQHEVISAITTTIATQSPVARDLRNLLTMNHVAYELERIADHASSVAKVAKQLAPEPALQRYLSEGGGLLPLIATETQIDAFGLKSQIPEIVWLPESVRHMIEGLQIEQLLSHQRWAELLAQSGSVWITSGANSDGGSLRQALRSGARVISLDCQITRLASEQAGGTLELHPQLTVDDMVDTLHRVEADMGNAIGSPVKTSDLASLRREIGFVLDRLLEVGS